MGKELVKKGVEAVEVEVEAEVDGGLVGSGAKDGGSARVVSGSEEREETRRKVDLPSVYLVGGLEGRVRECALLRAQVCGYALPRVRLGGRYLGSRRLLKVAVVVSWRRTAVKLML